MPNPNPPMDMMPNEPMPMGNEMGEEPMGDDMNSMGDEDGANDDPKKNIQRLAGELSQALRT